jgi:ATP-dependent DNA ligase
MLAKLADDLPVGPSLYEPKWDGFRAFVFRGGAEVFIQSRDLRRSIATFPSCTTLLAQLPDGCVLDGEIVIATPRGLDFDALQLRLHPAASRVAKLAKETPARSSRSTCSRRRPRPARRAADERRARLERRSRARAADAPDADDARSRVARDWLARFEGAGLDGVIAKPQDALRAGQARDDQGQARAHRRLRGRRLPLAQEREGRVGSLLLGLYDDDGGCTTSA